MRALLVALCSTAIIAGCGGRDSPISSAQAQVLARVEVANFHFILRPDTAGRWFIQNDGDHAATGVLPTVEQGEDYLKVYFDRNYTHAGVITVSSDDDFKGHVSGYSNLGLSSAMIRVVVGGKVIDPASVRKIIPGDSGNFWVSVTMVNK